MKQEDPVPEYCKEDTPDSLSDWQAKLAAYVEDEWAVETDGSHDVGHLARVWRNCQRIAREEPEANLLILLASSYLHDLVNLPKSHPDRHLASRYSAAKSCEYLKLAGFPENLLDAVSHAIEAHSFSANITAKTLEAKILQDADRLEAIGALGIARCFYVAGQMSSSLFHPQDPFAKHRSLDDTRYAIDHFETKLFPIIETLNTPAARVLGEKHGVVMSSFLQTLQDEL